MDIVQLIDELDDVLNEASSVPFSRKVAVDPDEVLEILKEIRDNIPEEIKQAKWVNEERDRILNEANSQADKAREDAKKDINKVYEEAQNQYKKLVNEHEITKQATKYGEELVAKAEREAKEIKQGSINYVDKLLKKTSDELKNTLKTIEDNRGQLK